MSQTGDKNWLRRQAQAWAKNVVALHHQPVPEIFEAEKQALLNTAKTIKNAVEGVLGTVPELDPMNQLGFIPVVVGAVGVAGAAAAITKWTLDFKKFLARVNDRNALLESGMDPKLVQEFLVRSEGKKSTAGIVSGDMKQIATIGGLAFAAWLLVKKMGVL